MAVVTSALKIVAVLRVFKSGIRNNYGIYKIFKKKTVANLYELKIGLILQQTNLQI